MKGVDRQALIVEPRQYFQDLCAQDFINDNDSRSSAFEHCPGQSRNLSCPNLSHGLLPRIERAIGT
jgi:hypothetical protein